MECKCSGEIKPKCTCDTETDQMSQPRSSTQLLKLLRSLMKSKQHVTEPIQAYVVPSGDAHQSEYIADCDRRRAFISGFQGSAGTAVVTDNHACMWTDGRYFLQATKEMDSNWTLMKEGVPSTPTKGTWLAKTLPAGSRVGADPMLLDYSEWRTLCDELHRGGHTLVPVPLNLIDAVWDNKPSFPNGIIEPLSVKYTGKSVKTKVDEVRVEMTSRGAEVLVITFLDEVAWLLNLRGCDVLYNPVFFSYAVLTMKQIDLFVSNCKITQAVKSHFGNEGVCVQIHPYECLQEFIKGLLDELDGKVWISNLASYGLVSMIPENKRIVEITPVALMKAIKNPVESEGIINAHIKDAAAVVAYFAWLEKALANGEKVTETSGADKLEGFRREQENFIGPSFDTISSVGPNAAIIHYMPKRGQDSEITTKELYLCDSGGQYRDGTTDITRTVHMGTPTQFEKECFTRVFKGVYALATCVFPSKIKGNYLDSFARKALWDVGLDYAHGTGHGIGHYLNVHEGPMGISWRTYPDDPGLQEGMFLSDEPGYYEDGKFGIRLENIVRIVPAKTPHNFKDRGFLTFQTVTLVPIQTKMLVPEMLTQAEITYLNEYHAKCREKVGPLLQKLGHADALKWLNRETQPIG